MLRSLKAMFGYTLEALDGEIGRCKDFLFDDLYWVVRHMVADTGKWLPGRRVVLSPMSLGEPDWASKRFPVELTKERIESAPPLDENAPVSRQHEMAAARHYRLHPYWIPTGSMAMPVVMPTPATESPEPGISEDEQHLRSVSEVIGYTIQSTDDKIGCVHDFIVEDESWALRYMVVDTSHWWPDRKVLVAPEWLKSIDWNKGQVSVHMSAAAVRDSPEYVPTDPVNREYEARLYDYYGRPKHWV